MSWLTVTASEVVCTVSAKLTVTGLPYLHRQTRPYGLGKALFGYRNVVGARLQELSHIDPWLQVGLRKSAPSAPVAVFFTSARWRLVHNAASGIGNSAR